MTWAKLIEALPIAGTNPFAFVSYLVLVGGFLYYFHRKSKSEDFLKMLALLPEGERGKAARDAGYNYDVLKQLPEGERLTVVLSRHRAILFVISALALVSLLVIWIVEARQIQAARAEAFLKQGYTFEQTQNYSSALTRYIAADAVRPSSRARARTARCLTLLGKTMDARAFIEEALHYKFDTAGELIDKADLIRLLALGDRKSGELNLAKKRLDEAEALVKRTTRTEGYQVLAMIYNQRGNIFATEGHFEKAVPCYESAIAFDKKAFDSFAEVADRGNLASVFNRINEPIKASAMLSEGILIARRSKNPRALAPLLYKQARVLEDSDVDAAKRTYIEALSATESAIDPDTSLEAKVRGDYGQLLIEKLRNPKAAHAHLIVALHNNFKERDTHGVLAQTDGLFQFYGSMSDPKYEAACGIAAYRLAVLFGNESERSEIKARLHTRNIFKNATSFFGTEKFFDNVCEALFECSAVTPNAWREQLNSFSLSGIEVKG